MAQPRQSGIELSHCRGLQLRRRQAEVELGGQSLYLLRGTLLRSGRARGSRNPRVMGAAWRAERQRNGEDQRRQREDSPFAPSEPSTSIAREVHTLDPLFQVTVL